MKKNIFFIERSDTNEWLHTKRTWKQGRSVHEGDWMLTLEWTNDPFIANQFKSEEMATSDIKLGVHSFELKKLDLPLIITEHEFTITPKQ